jgi:uncharacterized protein YjbI with pentapeptide repeats
MTPGSPEVRIATKAPVSTGAVVWRARGQLYATVVVKATFSLVNEQAMELGEPAELFRGELHHRDNPSRSVRATSDLVPYLNRADVVLTGHACAPSGTRVPMVTARLAVFREQAVLDKTVHVYGDRKGGSPAPFDKMPLVYEKAIGGVGKDDNPLGTGMRAGGAPDLAAANVVHPADPSLVAGFGPISRTWPARRRLLGKTDRKALDRPIVELPESFDWAYFQAAPPDQQIDYLRGDEWVVLDGMHPDMPRIASRLPGARITGTVTGLAEGAGARPMQFLADMLRIDADAQSCSVVWRSAVPVRDEAAIEGLRFTVALEVAGQQIEWSDQAADEETNETIDLDDSALIEVSVSMDDSDFEKTIPREDRAPRAAAPQAGASAPQAGAGAPQAKREGAAPEAGGARPEKTSLWTPEMVAALRAPPEEEGTLKLPKMGGAAKPAQREALTQEGTLKLPKMGAPSSKHEGTVALSLDDQDRAAEKAAVPFASAPAEAAAPAPAASKHEATMALSPEEAATAAHRPQTPFSGEAAPRSRSFVARPLPGAPWSPKPTKARPLPKPNFEQTVTTVGDAPTSPPGSLLPASPPGGLLPASPPGGVLPASPPAQVQPSFMRAPAPPLAPAAPAPASATPVPSSGSPSTPPPAAARSVPPSRPAPPAARLPGREASIRSQDVPRRAQDAVPAVHKTPFVVFTTPWQLKAGMDSLAVIVKATCDLVQDGPATLRPEAEPPSGDVHDEGDAARTLLYSTDFAVFKPRADVTLTGHAYPPGGSSPAAQARFRFGHRKNGFDRRIAVFGERRWQKAGIKLAPTAPRPFKKIPLVYERAFGGPAYDRNPQGIGLAGDLLPQLEDPASLVKAPDDTPEPACFAPVPPSWPARRSKLGTFGAEWKRDRWPFFPDDFDWEHFQAAPPAQQLDHLQGDEPYELAGVHPERPVISGRLPGVRPRCFAQKTSEAGGEFHEVILRLDTVAFEPDEMRVTLVWRGLLDVVDEAAEDIAELFVMEEALAGPSLDRAEAFSRYRAMKLPPAPDEVAEGAPPANDAAPETEAQAPPPIPELSPEKAAELRASVVALLAQPGAPLDGMDLAGADLSDLDFSGRSMKHAVLARAKLGRAKLAGADLTGAQLGDADLRGADLRGADLTEADLTRVELGGAALGGAVLAQATFAGARAEGARFEEARGDGAVFADAVLKKARFDRATLGGADFTRAELSGAVLDAAELPDVRLYDATGTAVSFNGAKLQGARADGVTLRRSSLARVQARSSVWDKACLDESTFLGAALAESGFARASCRGTVFSGADLTAGRLRRGAFRGAAFLKANLMTATLEAADLEGADLRGANLHGAETYRAKLAGAKLDLAIVTQTKLAEGA